MQRESLREAILNRRMLICVFTGFTSGLPLYVLIQLVPAWLKVEGVGIAEIGFFTLVGFPYTWKFLWSPAMDRYTLPFLGRRRGWMLVTQVALLLSIAALGLVKPSLSIWTCRPVSDSAAPAPQRGWREILFSRRCFKQRGALYQKTPSQLQCEAANG